MRLRIGGLSPLKMRSTGTRRPRSTRAASRRGRAYLTICSTTTASYARAQIGSVRRGLTTPVQNIRRGAATEDSALLRAMRLGSLHLSIVYRREVSHSEATAPAPPRQSAIRQAADKADGSPATIPASNRRRPAEHMKPPHSKSVLTWELCGG